MSIDPDRVITRRIVRARGSVIRPTPTRIVAEPRPDETVIVDLPLPPATQRTRAVRAVGLFEMLDPETGSPVRISFAERVTRRLRP